jgi:hypothetical protein
MFKYTITARNDEYAQDYVKQYIPLHETVFGMKHPDS